MGADGVLRSSIQDSHGRIGAELDGARHMTSGPDDPRAVYERLDSFLAATSRHLYAVDAVLVPAARRSLPDGRAVVHDYLRSSKRLERALLHLKAREYGSAYASSQTWPQVWAEVADALEDQQQREEELGAQLGDRIPDQAEGRLAERLQAAEDAAPTRPHPYVPHTGPLGHVARRVTHTVDRFWDATRGSVPDPLPPPRKEPGLMTQYLLGEALFDEDTDEDSDETPDETPEKTSENSTEDPDDTAER